MTPVGSASLGALGADVLHPPATHRETHRFPLVAWTSGVSLHTFPPLDTTFEPRALPGIMDKPATTDFPVHALIRDRWSPRAFGDAPVSEEELRSLLEAARWAPSSFNEQPWAFIVARREDGATFDDLLACFNESNQRWASGAGALIITLARTELGKTGKPNRHALHDVGIATGLLAIQATALGLRIHPAGGFSREAVVERFGVPDVYEPVAAIGVGTPGDPDSLPDDLRDKELAPRARKAQSEFVFTHRFGEPR
jgi:nitroreductase